MMPLVVVLAFAVALGALSGGTIGKLALVRFRHERPIMVCIACAVVLPRLSGLIGLPAWFVQVAWLLIVIGLTALLAVNAVRHPALGLVVAGLLMNLLAIAANSGMPVLAPESIASPARLSSALVANSSLHLVDTAVRLAPLCDVMPLRTPWIRLILSPGDLMLFIGLAMAISSMMTSRKVEGLGGVVANQQ